MLDAVRSKVERHAAGLENAAKAMSADGIGLDHLKGHAAILRRMASAMRQDASMGKLPHVYNDSVVYASAGDSAMQGPMLRALQACGLESLGPTDSISLVDFDESARASGASMENRFLAKQILAKQQRLTG